MRTLFLLLFITLTLSCRVNKQIDFDFLQETGMTEAEFYNFLINDYSKRLDSLSSKKVRILYSYAARPIKIEFENGVPTTLEPPGTDFRSIRTYKLDQNKLRNFKLISADVYSKTQEAMRNDDCHEFEENIGDYIVCLNLPWYNPMDSSLLMRESWEVCPPHYHQGAGSFGRYKKIEGHWTLDYD